MSRNDWTANRLERDARIAEALSNGPMTATGVTRQILGITTTERVPRSQVARVVQSLRVMEREGIVQRGRHVNKVIDWRLSR